MTTETFTTAGTFTWTAPANVTQVFVECWGGGGGSTGGGNVLGAGGGGGEYAAESAYSVTPGNSYTYVVGIAGSSVNGSPGGNGGDSSFDGTGVVAHGGKGGTATGSSGTGGAGGTGSTNAIHFNGGHGGAVHFKDDGGAGGGGSGGSASAGNNGADATPSGPGAGGAAVTGGGPGANGASSGAGITPSTGPGGGAGGGFPSSGAFGFAGQVQLTYGTGTTKVGTDTGSFGSETGTVQIQIRGTETGSFAENTPGFNIRVSDTGTFSESGSIHASLSDTDFFTASAETGSVSILITGTDTGSFAETSAQALTGVIDSDSGSFMETANIITFEAPPIVPLSVFYPTILKPVVSPIFYGVKHTSTVGVVRWTTFTTSASRLDTSWKIIAQQIVTQQVTQWDNYFRRHKILMGYRFGLPTVVVNPIDWRYPDNQVAYQDEVRRSATSGTSWDTLKSRVITKQTSWMLRISGSTFRRTRFNVLLRISIPTDASTRYYGIEQPVVHPIAADSLLPSSPALEWDIDTSIILRRKVAFNALDSRVKKIAVWWNTKDTSVVKQSGVAWKVRQRKSSSKATAFKVIFRWPNKYPTAWMDNHVVVKQKQTLFNDLLKVRKQVATEWESTQHVVKTRVTSFRVYVPRKVQKSTQFKVRFRYSLTEIPGTLKFNARIPQSTVHPITFAPAFSPAEQSTWNFIFEVTTQKATAFGVKKKVSAFRASNWESIQRTSKQQPTKFNTILAVTEQAIIEWNVGEVVSERIHQTSIDRVDFAY